MSKDREELIEVMAGAICREYGDPGEYWIAYADLAEAALSAIEGAGFELVSNTEWQILNDELHAYQNGYRPGMSPILTVGGLSVRQILWLRHDYLARTGKPLDSIPGAYSPQTRGEG